MNRKLSVRLLVLVASLMVLLLAFTSAASANGGRPLVTIMTGNQEAPGPGDPDGFGAAAIWLNQGQGEVCWEIHVRNITLPATAAHIHIAPPGAPGPVVVPLSPPDASGHASGCRAVSEDLIKAIRQNPENYYVNVHNADYPPGAVRGQLTIRGALRNF